MRRCSRRATKSRPHRKTWIQVARGAVTVNGQALAAGDGAAISEEDSLAIRATEDTELLLFDMR